MTKTMTACVIAMVLSACAADDAQLPDDDLADDAVDVDAGEVVACDSCALGEWHLAAVACATDLELHIRIGTNHGVPFVASLTEPIVAGGVVLADGAANVYVKDGANTVWSLELLDDGVTASAAASLDVGGCEWVGDATVTDRVR